MFIDTHSRESMINSIRAIFNISQLEWIDFMYEISQIIDDNENNHQLDKLIRDKISEYPDEILLFHLSRRLHGTENETCGQNLADLLTTKNAFSDLLKSAGIEFARGENHIETIYKGKPVDWDDCFDGNSSYMKVRLGYYKGREDYCFNGFAFKDLLYKNDYARQLFDMPEFLGQLINCLGCKSVGSYYMKHSDYYCYEYKIPMNMAVFDGKDKYTHHQKQHYLIKCVLKRLVDYQTNDIQFIFDHDNPIVRLPDNYIVPSEYFVKKEKITNDMLKY